MFRQLISRDRQELRAPDLNNMQDFSREGLEALFSDGIGTGQYYAGLNTTQTGPTEVRVAPGRYWKNGQVYARLPSTQLGVQAELLNLLEYLPTQYEKAIALVTFDRELSTNVEPRDFLISLDTLETEPQAVPMHLIRTAEISAIEGTESPQPQIPIIPGGVLHFCTVYMGPTGILRIEMVEATRVPSTSGIYVSLEEFLRWKLSVEAQIESLRAMLAALLAAIKNFSPLKHLRMLGLDVARLKERANLPDNYSQYSSDWFISADETDPAYPGYDARIDNGLLFPTAAAATFNMALLAPGDASVIVNNGLVLPAHTHERRFGTAGYTGQDMPLASEQQTFETKSFTIASFEHAYGWSWNQYGAWWSQNYNKNTDFRQGPPNGVVNWETKTDYAYNWTQQWNQYWTVNKTTHQYVAPTVTTVVGAMAAQTFLCPASMWLTKIGLNFTKIDTVGDVTLIVCETSNTGEPLLKQSLCQVTVPKANLKLHSQETVFSLPPTYLWAGRRYALCVVSQGAHRLATVSGKNFTEGTLFLSTNGQFFDGDLTKDLLFSVYGARFNSPRTVVALQSAALAGGISDLSIKAGAYVPEGTELQYEIQVGGAWYPLADPINRLLALPDTLPLRAVFLGSTDVQPGLMLTPNSIRVSRSKNAFVHWSILRTLAGNSGEVVVKLRSFNFVPTQHTLVAQIQNAAGTITYNAALSTIQEEPDGSRWHSFEFTVSPAINAYRVKIVGSRASASVAPFVVIERLDIAV